jgi:hypothetical protein
LKGHTTMAARRVAASLDGTSRHDLSPVSTGGGS